MVTVRVWPGATSTLILRASMLKLWGSTPTFTSETTTGVLAGMVKAFGMNLMSASCTTGPLAVGEAAELATGDATGLAAGEAAALGVMPSRKSASEGGGAL